VFTPIGISRDDLVWRENAYRPHKIDDIPRREFGSGVSANVDALARIGYLYLRQGRWQDRELLSRDFVRQAGTTAPAIVGLPVTKPENYGNASNHYGLLWWNNADGTLADVPRDAFWSWGLHDSLIVVIPSLDIVASRVGSSWKRASDEHYDVLKPFLAPIAAAAEGKASPAKRGATPYPQSKIIQGVEWAPAACIVRRAIGSDNWPLTWGDDGLLYTAYGDGRGFEPFVERKLSLGLATIRGEPENFKAANLRSPTVEQRGDGASGKKASGLLMVDGVLYLLVRNARNAQLAWSQDRGQTWTWSDWSFTESFGCPSFVNYGENYAGAPDEFVYLVSHDADSAYQPADRMVLARVDRHKMTERSAYQFFAGRNPAGEPLWTSDISDRAAAFEHHGRCYRSAMIYHAGLRRYLWCQILPGGDSRFAGGLGIYDAPAPWGPWTTAFFTEKWDVGPGETASIPTKWIRPESGEFHLVFSGDDCFSVRNGKLLLAAPASNERSP
jgi:hypothetical protein